MPVEANLDMEPDERVLMRCRVSWIAVVVHVLALLCGIRLSAVLIGVPLVLWMVYRLIYMARQELVITNRRVLGRCGAIRMEVVQSEFGGEGGCQVIQLGLWARVFGYGKIQVVHRIAEATGERQDGERQVRVASFICVEHVNEVMDAISIAVNERGIVAR